VRAWSLGRNEASWTFALGMKRNSVSMLAAIVVTLSGCAIFSAGYHVQYYAPYYPANAANSLATEFCIVCENLNMEKVGDTVIRQTRSISYMSTRKSGGVEVSLFIQEGADVLVFINSGERENPFALRCRTEIEQLLKAHGFNYKLGEWVRTGL